MKRSENKIKSIICIHQGYELYGSDRSFALSVEILRKLYIDAEITVVIPNNGPVETILKDICDVLIINKNLGILRKKELKKKPFMLVYKILKGMFHAINQSKQYDIVYVNTIVVLDYILAARFMKSIKILHIREIPIGLQAKIFSKIISFSKMNVIFNSQNTKNAFNLSPKLNQTVLLNGVSGLTNTTLKESRDDNNIRILLLGRLTEWKGQLFFLHAINKLIQEKKYNINIRIVGEVFEDQVEYKNSLIEYVQKCKLESNIIFKSFTENPESEFLWSDIVVVPSIKPEPFGRVAIEAMSAKKCVIAANHGGLKEIIKHDENGLLFEPANVDSLIKMISKVIDSPKLLKVYSEKGFLTYQQKFSNEIYQKNFIKIIKDFCIKGK